MAPRPTLHIIYASDAPLHLGNLTEILQRLKEENRISGFVQLKIGDDLSSLDTIEGDDLAIILLTNQLEAQKKEIESSLNMLKSNHPSIKIAEIIVDQVPYENEYITFPDDLKPIRDREDMDAVWSSIERSLKDMFPKQDEEPVSKPVDWPKYLKITGIVILMISLAFVFYKLFNNDPLREREIDPPITDISTEPTSDFPEGSHSVYLADFSEWPTKKTEHGSVTLGFGNTYVSQPISNTWIGSGRMNNTPAVENDFVFDVRFKIEERNPSSSLRIGLTGSGTDAETIDLYFNVWDQGNVVYSLSKGRVRSGGDLSVPHQITEETVAEREQLSSAFQNQDWQQGNKLTLKREGGKIQFLVNDMFIIESSVSGFPVTKVSVGAAHPSKVVVTSIEGRTRN